MHVRSTSIAITALMTAAAPAIAGNSTLWLGGSGDFVSNNWSTGIPGPAEVAVFDLNEPAVITFPASGITNLGLEARKGLLTFEMNGGAYALDFLELGDGGAPLTTITLAQAGQLTASTATIGGDADSWGSLSVGDASTFDVASSLVLGGEGRGQLSVLGGSSATVPPLVLGVEPTGDGKITLLIDGVLDVSAESASIFGQAGEADVTVLHGTLTAGDVVLAQEATADADLFLDNIEALASFGELIVAESGRADVTIRGGGRVEAVSMHVGKFPGADGDVEVGSTNPNAAVSTLDVQETLGVSQDEGLLKINAAGEVVAGQLTATTGTVELNGGSLRVGGFNVATAPFTWTAGTLHLTDQNLGLFAIDHALHPLSIGPTRTLVVDLALDVYGTSQAAGSFTVDGGSVDCGDAFLGRFPDEWAFGRLFDGSWTVQDDFDVAPEGVAALDQTGGILTVGDDLRVGPGGEYVVTAPALASIGMLQVTAGGVQTDGMTIFVMDTLPLDSGFACLFTEEARVSGGGTWATGNAPILIAPESGSSGEMLVTGVGTTLDVVGTTPSIALGEAGGEGTLIVEFEARLTADDAITIGPASDLVIEGGTADVGNVVNDGRIIGNGEITTSELESTGRITTTGGPLTVVGPVLLRSSGTVQIAASETELSTLRVDGPLTLDGTLELLDVGLAPEDGDALLAVEAVGDSFVEGAFSATILPDGFDLVQLGGDVWITYTDPCPADLDDSGHIGFNDLSILLGSWGECLAVAGCGPDLDDSGHIGFNDLSLLLGSWGACP